MAVKFRKWAFITPSLCRHMSEYYAGIMDFLRDHPDVILERLTFAEADLDHVSKLDGFITYAMPPRALLREASARRLPRPPVVSITMSKNPPKEIACAYINPSSVAERVVAKFLQRNCVSLAFCACHTKHLTDESAALLRAFRSAAYAHTGKMPQLFRPFVTRDPNLLPAEVERFTRWLAKIPKPCGILVHGDEVAKKMLDSCRVMGIDVPRELRVIGTGNSPLYCERTIPTLSSFAVDHERTGYLAARALMAMTKGASPRKVSFEVEIPNIVERASSVDLFGSGHLTQSVRHFIQHQISLGISPSIRDIALHCGVSKSKLQENFKASTGHTVHEELADYRLKTLARLLKRSSESVQIVAARAGLAVAQANRVFQKRYGMTMTEFRRRA